MKKVYANCSICKSQLTIELSTDIAKDREFYPFEYINIHGNPEHALMLFLDQNLAIRESIAYKDLSIAQKKKIQYQTLINMPEIDALAAIYDDALCLRLYTWLTNGPYTEEGLVEQLKKENSIYATFFDVEEKFNSLIMPLIRTGLVKTSWLEGGSTQCYFLVKDFIALRTSLKYIAETLSSQPEFKSFMHSYFEALNESMRKYRQIFSSDGNAKANEIHLCLKLRSTLKYLKIFNLLHNGPQTSEQLSEIADKEELQDLIDKGFIMKLKTKAETYYILLNDIRIKKFTPQYLINPIAKRLVNKEITREMALKHLEFLYESENKLE